ncbi:peptidylprolyl isomerase [Pontibacter sp. G13]|uniref:peptidylprolyl isomerase n=1 Tax=Pontibacter sp. G13 TaxID=3074898 RepID=UPI002889C7DC|nr:peptidylprolyl isomerase [Pontibacter sp. G13]WNJ19049.1 peptidylprolyl isomerase [Pontibacter sp. G13]
MILKIIQEPLVHFLAAGFLFFIAYAWLGNPESERQIRIDQYTLNEMVSKWHQQWDRDPSEAELKGLLDHHIKQEILSREAQALGLDQDDDIIRKRLAQKMEFIAENMFSHLSPSDEELLQFLEQHSERYQTDLRISFRQVCFRSDLRERPAEDAAASLNTGVLIGDSNPAKPSYQLATSSEIRKDLGADFTQSLEQLEVSNGWQGPIPSAFGEHLVLIEAKATPQAPDFESIRQRLTQDYVYALRQEYQQDLMRELLEKYEVVIDLPEIDYAYHE